MATINKEINKTIQQIRKKGLPENNQMIYGKLPPQSKDLEEAVLGALMLEKDAVPTVIDFLKPESFYVEAHKFIFEAIVSLFNNSKPIDILTVVEALRKQGTLEIAGGAYYITELTNRVATAANVEYHARIISEKFIQRELIRTSTEIARDAYEDTTDVFELLDRSENNLFQITNQNMRRNYADLGTLVNQAHKDIINASEHQDKLTGVASGFTRLDRLTGGWQKSDLIIIAARPGMGKTAFVISMARNAASIADNKAVAIFSLEMSSLQLTTRLIASESGLPIEKLRKGNLANYELKQLESKISELKEAPIYIDDTPALNIFELRAKARRLKMQHNVQMIIIDYLQLMSGGTDNKNGNREQEISNISRSLKNIAKELNIPVIALSQLSRAVETRGGNKRPMLSDLRESGAIEQDADMVVFLYRAEYYQIETDDNGQSTKNKAEVIIAKHRNGGLDTVPVRFINELAKFEDWDDSKAEQDNQNSNHSHDDFIDRQSFTTVQSKMNDIKNEETDGDAKIDYDLDDPF